MAIPDPLAGPDDFRETPGSPSGLSDATIELLLRRASQRFRTATEQHISQVVDDVIVLDSNGSSVLLLPELPVTAVTQIVVDGTDVDSTGLWSDKGILNRWAGSWPRAFRKVEVTYTHGYEDIPDDIIGAVCEAAIIAARNTPGIAGGAVQAGPFQVQLAGGPTGSGGATASWTETVGRYRVRQ